MSNEREIQRMCAEAELLNDAAKVMGFILQRQQGQAYIDRDTVWCPAHDNGDSDRLGTEIEANVQWYSDMVVVYTRSQSYGIHEYFADHNGDKQKALRWARLRCAAEIGRNMK